MKLTIIPSDKTVYYNYVAYGDIDLSWIPEVEGKQIHAVQWLDEDDDGVGEGEVEFVGNHQNLPITTLGIEGVCIFNKAIEQWQEKKDEEDALIQKQLEDADALKKQIEEEAQAQFLREQFEFRQNTIEYSELSEGESVDENDEEEDLYYDIEELLKEI